MPIKTKEELKLLFEQGDKPSQQDFIDLIDTLNDADIITSSIAAAKYIDYGTPITIGTTALLTIGKHHVCSGTTTDYIITLPSVSENAGKLISVAIAHTCTKLITLSGLIDGATSRIMWAGETATLLCDGAGWTKIAGKSIPMAGMLYGNMISQVFSAMTYTKINLNYTYGSPTILADLDNKRLVTKRDSRYLVRSGLEFTGLNTTAGVCFAAIYINGVSEALTGFPRIASAVTTALSEVTNIYTAGTIFELYGYYTGGSYSTTCIQVTARPRNHITIQEIPTW